MFCLAMYRRPPTIWPIIAPAIMIGIVLKPSPANVRMMKIAGMGRCIYRNHFAENLHALPLKYPKGRFMISVNIVTAASSKISLSTWSSLVYLSFLYIYNLTELGGFCQFISSLSDGLTVLTPMKSLIYSM